MGAKSERLIEVVARWTGIDLERGGRGAAVDHFIENRTRVLKVSADAYVHALDGPEHPEVRELVQAITVGHTWFYRDPEQLELISRLARSEHGTRRPVQVWIPGCATGEDVYTLAMLAERDGWKASILGTDINAGFIDHARTGHYAEWSLRELPRQFRAHFRISDDDQLAIVERLRSNVSFRQHNLLEPPVLPSGGAWDFILCRNVLIYFRAPQTTKTIGRLGGTLALNGWLFLGATDVISSAPPGLCQVPVGGRSAFRRITDPPRRKSRPAPPPVSHAPGSGHAARTTLPKATAESQSPPATREKLLTDGVAALEAGRPSEALAHLIKALELDPLSGETHLFAGIAYHQAGDGAAALQALRAAILLEPDLWLASFYLALTYEKLGRPSDAKREFRIVAHALSHPVKSSRKTLLSHKLEVWEKDIASFARSRSR